MSGNHHDLVFIGGLHRSGTTPVARLLGSHPAVSGFSGTGVTEDEGQHLQRVYPAARTYGGAGRFALDPAAHLTEASPLATPEAAAALMAQWTPYWDVSRRVLVEKSPPNLVMTRFLQSLFPDARFVVVVRHPAVVALSTGRWRRTSSLRRLVEHWLAGHETFLDDAPRVRALHVLKYEDLVRRPESTLGNLGHFLGLEGPIPHDTLQTHRSDAYEAAWQGLRDSRRPWIRLPLERTLRDLEPRVRRFGYSLRDLSLVEPFPTVEESGP